MKKIMTILGTRPEIIKLSEVIRELDRTTNHILVHTGQNYDYELNQVFFDDLGLRKPDLFLDAAGKSPAETIGNVIIKSDIAMAEHQPDAILLYGDTNSCLSVIPAKRRKIPVFHMEAGNRCFDQRVPEEINRKIVDHSSDINMTITEHARRYLISEGIRPETVIKIGSSMDEVLKVHSEKIKSSVVLDRLGLSAGGYFVVSIHREENVDDETNFRNLIQTLNGVAQEFGRRIIVSTHPRTQKRLQSMGTVEFSPLIEFMKPLGFFDYVALQKSAYCTLSDSGTITEEASLLGFPAITIRQSHERPEGMDEGTLIMAGLKVEDVINCINIIRGQADRGLVPSIVHDYQVDSVSLKVCRIIHSYIGYVQRTVWRNYSL